MRLIGPEKLKELSKIDDSRLTGVSHDGFVDIVFNLRSGHFGPIDLTYYTIGLIERNEIEEAKKFIDDLIENDTKFYAGVLAENLFDYHCAEPSDEKWVEYFSIAGEDKVIYEIEAVGTNIHDNYCGFWVPGHKKIEDYIENFKEEYGLEIEDSDVIYGYLEKKVDCWLFHDEYREGFLAITTCLDIKIMRAAYPDRDFIDD